MKITIEIEPNRFTRFLGSQARKLKTARQHATGALKSRLSALRQAKDEGVSKAATS